MKLDRVLTDSSNLPDPIDRTDPAAVEKWIQEWLNRDALVGSNALFQNYKSHRVDHDGTVYLDGTFSCFNINQRSIKSFKRRIPLNFSVITGTLLCTSAAWIETFEGFPQEVGRILNVSGTSITSYEHIPTKMHHLTMNDWMTDHLNDKALSKLTVDSINLGIIKSGVKLPRIAFINGLDTLSFSFKNGDRNDHDKQRLFKIVNSHLNSGRRGAFTMQQELIEAGFEEFSDI